MAAAVFSFHRPLQRTGRSRTPRFGQVEPAGAPRREIQIAAVKAHKPPAGQFRRRFFAVGLGLEGGRILNEFGIAFAAVLPFLINMLQARHLRITAHGVVPGDGVVPGVADAAALVVPDEGVIAFKGVGQLRVPLKQCAARAVSLETARA